tara:strand:- start:241 stop:420 length:180 start_codon:yes stop_codon:yes gene_type:complete
MKVIEIKKNDGGGVDLLVGNNEYDKKYISTGPAERSEKFWIDLINEAHNALDILKGEAA